MAETFPQRLRRIRRATLDFRGRPISQEKAAGLVGVSSSCWRGWEHEPPRSWPDDRNRKALETHFPGVFDSE